jgi:DNA-binding PadR family transcriptional regulator
MGGREATERSALAMRSPVNWALLGLVIQRPSYGYELVQRFERTFAEVLELSSPSQIYTALDSLAKRDLIEEMLPPCERDVVRQPKPHYRATRSGVRSYSEWLLSQLDDEHRRGRLAAQQLALLPPEEALSVIDRHEQACLKDASVLGSGPRRRHGSPDGSSALVERLATEDDRLKVGARLAWLEYARRELEARAAPQTHR